MNENAARVAWAGAGVALPRRLITPRGVRLGLRKLLGKPGYARRAAELRDWALEHDGGATAAAEVEALAER
jgi:UDP:flavonoid glycosyltransferase YjiC (YdhE family)